MNYYFNLDQNICATEGDAVDFIIRDEFYGNTAHEAEVTNYLRSDREYCG